MRIREFIVVPQSSNDFAGLENVYGYVLYDQNDTIKIKDFTTYLPLKHMVKNSKIGALVEYDHKKIKENLGVSVIMNGYKIVDYYYN